MKKLIFSILLLLAIQISLAQETPPPGLKALTTATRYYNPIDSSIWTYKGTILGWHREGKYEEINKIKAGDNNWTGVNTYVPGKLRVFADGVGIPGYAPFLVSDYTDSGKIKSVNGLSVQGDNIKVDRPFVISSKFDFNGQQPLFQNGFYTQVGPDYDFSANTNPDSLKILTSLPMSIPDRKLGYVGYLPLKFIVDKVNKSVDSLKVKIDTGYIKNQNAVMQPAVFNVVYGKSAAGFEAGNASQNVGFNPGGISLFNDFQHLSSTYISPNHFDNQILSPDGQESLNRFYITTQDDATYIGGLKKIFFTSETPVQFYAPPVDSFDVVRLIDLNRVIRSVDTNYIKNSYWTGTKQLESSINVGYVKAGNIDATGISLANENYNISSRYNAGNINIYTPNGSMYQSSGILSTSLHAENSDPVGAILLADTTFNRFMVSSSHPIFLESSRLFTDAVPTQPDDIVRLQDLNTAVSGATANYLNKSGGILTGDLMLSSATPNNPLSAAPKAYVDNLISGITWKNAVRAKSTGNITLSGIQTIDGVAGIVNGRYLLNNQTNPEQNGIWIMQTGSWTRPADADESSEITTSTVAVTGGSINKNTQWTYIGSSDPVIGTDAISYGQISGAGTYTASNGVNLTANVFTLDPTFARGLLSATGSLTYNSNTGQFSAPTNLAAFSNDAGYQTTAVADNKYIPLTGGTSTGKQVIQNTTEQLRLAYNNNSYTSFAANSDGSLTISPTGNSLTVSGSLSVGAITSTGTASFTGLATGGSGSNLYIPTNSGLVATNIANFQYAGSSGSSFRVAVGSGTSNTNIANGRNYSGFIVLPSISSLPDGGNVPWASNTVLQPLGNITLGTGSSVTNTSTLYINGTSSAGTNNYSIYSASGLVNLVNAGENLRLSYDASNYASLTTSSTGQLIVSTNANVVNFGSNILYANDFRNTSTTANARLQLATTGTIVTRDAADANHALVVNLNNASSTGFVQQWRFQNTGIASMSSNGNMQTTGAFIGTDIRNIASSSNSIFQATNSGAVIARNMADANPTLIVNSQQGTSNIQVFQSAGTPVAAVNIQGRFAGAGLANYNSANNSFISMGNNGTSVTRNIADNNAAMAITNANASSTGNILNFGNTSGLRSFINLDGEYENNISSKGIILKSADGTRYRVTVANGGALQTIAL